MHNSYHNMLHWVHDMMQGLCMGWCLFVMSPCAVITWVHDPQVTCGSMLQVTLSSADAMQQARQ